MKIIRYCSVCESVLGKLRKATYMASGIDQNNYIQSWNECSNHTEFQNHLNLERTEKITFEQWFTEHGFDYDFNSGRADFPAKKKWQDTYQKTNQAVEDMLKKLAGTNSR